MKTLRYPHRQTGVILLGGLTAAFVMANSTLTTGQIQSKGQVTFTRDVAPILQRSCQNCHRPNGGLAPMALTTYEEVRPWAKAIKQRTSLREMPPWFIERNVGVKGYKDDPSLTDQEIATITAWVDGGAVRGNPADMPPMLEFTIANAWSFGEPDLVVTSPQFTVKAVGGDTSGVIPGETPTGLTEDRWIAAVQVREYRPEESETGLTFTPGRPGGGNDLFVIHHGRVSTELSYGLDGRRNRNRGGFSYLYEVGQNAQTYPEDMGIPLKAGSTIYFENYHLHSVGKKINLHAQVGFKFHPKGFVPKYTLGFNAIGDQVSGFGAELDIPGNTDNVRFDKFFTVSHPTKIVTFEPHLHASGKRMCYSAIYPNGNEETITCAGYNHNWAKSYVYSDDDAPLLPTGTVLHVVAWFDNTAANPRVVDPRNWRGLGNRSIDDMFIFMNKGIRYTEEEYKAEVARREAKKHQQSRSTTASRTTGN